MPKDASSEARERVLSVAERLFSEQGYHAVTLQNIASALQMQKASLYHHAPSGKEELFVEVMERHLAQHRMALHDAIAHAEPTLEARLTAIARWFLSQPPINLNRLTRSDITALSPSNAQHVAMEAHQSLLMPIAQVFIDAGIVSPDPILMAGTLISLIETVHDARYYSDQPSEKLMQQLITVLLHGVQEH